MDIGRYLQFGFSLGTAPCYLAPAIGLSVLLLMIASGCSRPDAQRLYFTSDRDGNLEIYSVNLSNGTEQNITNSGEDERFPTISKDRKAIVFLTEPKNTNPIDKVDNIVETMNIDGTDRFALTRRSAGFHSDTRWSPDGKRIVYLVDNRGERQILISPLGSKETTLLTTIAGDGVGDWSDDGQSVAFTVQNSDEQGVYIRNADGVNERRLTTGPDSEPVWSPDGSRIAFISTRDGNSAIFVINVDGKTDEEKITDGSESEYDVSWSPNGRKLLFVSEKDGNPEIYTADPDSMERTRLTNNTAMDKQPVWSPDGRKIAFVSNLDGDTEIFVMDAEGDNQKRITNNESADHSPSW